MIARRAKLVLGTACIRGPGLGPGQLRHLVRHLQFPGEENVLKKYSRVPTWLGSVLFAAAQSLHLLIGRSKQDTWLKRDAEGLHDEALVLVDPNGKAK